MMATLEHLLEQKEALEQKLYAGDISVEPRLAQLDKAIASRSRQIKYSQKRLAAVKDAVAKGMPVAAAKAVKPRTSGAKSASGTRKGLNRF
jgi:hypothetical protein